MSDAYTPPPMEQLKTLLDSEVLKLGVHIRKMNSPGSPIYRYPENIWPVALILTASFAGTVLVHYYLGAAILAVGCWWWVSKVQPKIRDGVFERASFWALQSEAHFEALWAKGVLTLQAKLPDGREFSASRRDDWRAFVKLVASELPENA